MSGEELQRNEQDLRAKLTIGLATMPQALGSGGYTRRQAEPRAETRHKPTMELRTCLRRSGAKDRQGDGQSHGQTRAPS